MRRAWVVLGLKHGKKIFQPWRIDNRLLLISEDLDAANAVWSVFG
mgnify:CR=1 FL=1